MGDKEPEKTLNVMALGAKVPFEGSIVALPFVTGWDDIENTAKFLRDSGAWSIRILAPGFSRITLLVPKWILVHGAKYGLLARN